jgi:hypothetical protein
MKADDEIKRQYLSFQEAIANRQPLDQSVVLNCVNAVSSPNVTLSLSQKTDQYWEFADVKKEAEGIRWTYEHSDAGSNERLCYLERGHWKFKPIRNWGSVLP